MKPILFNTVNTKAILSGTKVQTRRIVKFPENLSQHRDTIQYVGKVLMMDGFYSDGFWFMYHDDTIGFDIQSIVNSPYKLGDILYVRETWNFGYIESSGSELYSDCWFEPLDPDSEYNFLKAQSQYFYKADDLKFFNEIRMPWKPSIHMPKDAARLFLKVIDVDVQRLQDITDEDVLKEGFQGTQEEFGIKIWNATLDSTVSQYCWNSNPYVWVYEFEVMNSLRDMK